MKRLLPLLLLAGCFTRPCMMSRENYECITLGTAICDVVAQAGEPYSICTLCYDTEEYHFIEKLSINGGLAVENDYVFTVRDGVVIAKRLCADRPPSFNLIYSDQPNFGN